MPSLAELQRDIAGALAERETRVPAGVVGPGGSGARKRFNVYRNNVLVSLTEALAAAYPAVHRLLGEEYFAALAPLFIRAHPPVSPVLMFYGAAFAEFLDGFEPLSPYPYLGDVARIEWAWLTAYHAADVAPLAPAALAAIALERLGEARFVAHPATRVLSSAHPSLTLFRANREETDAAPAGHRGGEDTLVTRPHLDVEVRALPAGGAAFLRALIAGTSLGEAATVAAETAGEAFDLAANIGGMLEAGVFSALR